MWASHLIAVRRERLYIVALLSVSKKHAMYRSNQDNLLSICADDLKERECTFFHDFTANMKPREVPDPYSGSRYGFEAILNLVENVADGLIAHLQKYHSI